VHGLDQRSLSERTPPCVATHAPGHLVEIHAPLAQASLATLSRKVLITAAAIHYALSLWDAMVRYLDDGRIEIDNSAAERPCRGVAWAVATISSPAPIAEANAPPSSIPLSVGQLNCLDPEAYLRHVLTHIADHPITRIEELLPGTSLEVCIPQTNSQHRQGISSERVAFDPSSLPHIADLIDYGDITVGVIEPGRLRRNRYGRIHCLAMLVRRVRRDLAPVAPSTRPRHRTSLRRRHLHR